MNRLISIFFSLACLLLLTGSCKQGPLAKAYHNLTGKYNAFYNAEVRIEESRATLKQQHQDNYNKILPMYPDAAVADAAAVATPLDEAITKVTRNISLHKISHWVDDSYYLMGQSEYLLKDYERAANTFRFIVEKYSPEELEKAAKASKKKKGKKKKKKRRKKRRRKKKRKKSKKKSPKKTTASPNTNEDPEEEPENYFLKHPPIYYKAMIELAKTYTELKQYEEAAFYLRTLDNDGTVPRKLRHEIYAAAAYNFIGTKDYPKAIESLEMAVEACRKKKIKNRYVYILAQLYQQTGNNDLAMQNFKRILRLAPSYEMEFNARLNMAKSAVLAKSSKTTDPEKAIRRMIRDPKNAEYLDQLYFALAEIQLNSGKTDEGIASMQKSLSMSSRPEQQSEGAFMLAELFYEREDYVQAYAYFDTTSMSMPKQDERYDDVQSKRNLLKGVALNTLEAELQDSLLRIADWSFEEQKALIANTKKQSQQTTASGPKNNGKASVRRAEEERRNFNPNPSRNQKVSINKAALEKSKFALYNASMVKKGKKEFEKRWGMRSWKDNWKNAAADNDFVSDTGGEEEAVPMTNAEVQQGLKKMGVPQNDREKKAALDKYIAARFKTGSHYREDLRRYDLAEAIFKDIVAKHPESPYAVEALFALYGIAMENQQTSKAEKYKTDILANYPKSDIAKLLKDPNSAQSASEKLVALNTYYDQTYAKLRAGKAKEAKDLLAAVPEKFGAKNDLRARFSLLEAMCIGALEGEEKYIRALRVVVTSYPKTPEEAEAKKMIAILSGKKEKTDKNSQLGKNLFDNNLKTGHLILVVYDNPKKRVNNIKGVVNTYNKKHFTKERLAVSTLLIDGKLPGMIIRKFKSAEDAMTYVQKVESDASFLKGHPGFKVYAISQNNYRVVIQKRNFKAYRDFYEENY